MSKKNQTLPSLGKLTWDSMFIREDLVASEVVQKAIRIVGLLQEEINHAGGEPSTAMLRLSPTWLGIFIDEVCVWDSENSAYKDLKFQACRKEFTREVLRRAFILIAKEDHAAIEKVVKETLLTPK